jgi:hypothetical protein
LREKSSSTSFQEAILVASPSLAERLLDEKQKPWSYQLRQSVTQYLTRFVMKTSPFGLFVEVALGVLEDARSEEGSGRAEPQGPGSSTVLPWSVRSSNEIAVDLCPRQEPSQLWGVPWTGQEPAPETCEELRENTTNTRWEGRLIFLRRQRSAEELCSLPAAKLEAAGWRGLPAEAELSSLLLAAGFLEHKPRPLTPPVPLQRTAVLSRFRQSNIKAQACHVDLVRADIQGFSASLVRRGCEVLHPLCALLASQDAQVVQRKIALQTLRDGFRSGPVPLLVFYEHLRKRAPVDASSEWRPAWDVEPDAAGHGLWLELKPGGAGNVVRSFSSFVMPFQGDNGPSLVVQSVQEGYGRMASRLAFSLPPPYREATLDRNAQLAAQDRYADIVDGSDFRANHHPALLPWALVLPGGESSLPPERWILPGTLLVIERGGEPALVDKDGNRVFPMDLGLQSWGRGGFFEFLLTFSVARDISLSRVHEDVDSRLPPVLAAPGILYFERIWCQEALLRRRSWRVEPDALPPRAGKSLGRWWILLERWRRALGIPEICFLRLGTSDRGVPGEDADQHKPFYFHWESPLLIDILAHTIQRQRRPFWITEGLPLPSGKGSVEEWLIEWDGPA